MGGERSRQSGRVGGDWGCHDVLRRVGTTPRPSEPAIFIRALNKQDHGSDV